MSTISSGTTLTTALVQTGDTTGDLVIKTGSSNTTAMTISGTDQSVTINGSLTANVNVTTLTGVVKIENGGTNAATAADARTNLGTNDAANITTGTIATARLASGTANSSTYLRGDQTWASLSIPASNNKQIFTSSGTFTVPSGVTSVKVTVIGAGGNGGNGSTPDGFSGGGGGAGGYIVDYVTVTPGASVTVTVGTNAGTRTSSFAGGTTITAAGGANGGNAPNVSTAGTQGLSANSTIFGLQNYNSGIQRSGTLQTVSAQSPRTSSAQLTPTGDCWNSGFGAGGQARDGSGDARATAIGYGGGGGGGYYFTPYNGGGAGANGLVIVEW